MGQGGGASGGKSGGGEDGGKLVGGDGFEENGVEPEGGGIGLEFDVGRDDDDADGSEARIVADGADEGVAVEVGHPHVGENEVEGRVGGGIEEFQGLLPVGGEGEVEVSQMLEVGLEDHEVHLGVVDEEDAAGGGGLGRWNRRDGLGRGGRRGRRGGSGSRGNGGKGDGESGTLAEGGGGGQGAAHGGGELAADGKSQAGAAVAGTGVAELDIGGADAGKVFGGDAASGVFDLEGERAGSGAGGESVAGAEFDVPLVGELDGVSEEVEGNLAEALGVEEEEGHGGNVEAQVEGVVGPGGPEGVEDEAEEGGDVGRFGGDLHFAGFELGEVEDVVDETEERLAGDGDGVEGLGAFGGVVDAALEHFGKPDDGVERGADVVGDGGEEVGLGAGLFEFVLVFAAAEDGVEGEHEGEGEDGEAGLDEVVAEDGAVDDVELGAEGGAPVGDGRRGVAAEVVFGLVEGFVVGDDGFEGALGGLRGGFADPQEGHEEDDGGKGEPDDRGLAEAAGFVVAEDEKEGGEAGDAPEDHHEVGLGRHQGGVGGESGEDVKEEDDDREDEADQPGGAGDAGGGGAGGLEGGGGGVGVGKGGADEGQVDHDGGGGAAQGDDEDGEGGDGQNGVAGGAVGGGAAQPGGEGAVGGHGAEEAGGRDGVADEVREDGGEEGRDDDGLPGGAEGRGGGGEGGVLEGLRDQGDGGGPVGGAFARREGRNGGEEGIGGDGGRQGGHHDQEGALGGKTGVAGNDGDGLEADEQPRGEGHDAQDLGEGRRGFRAGGEDRRHGPETAALPQGRQEAGDDAREEHDGEYGLEGAGEAPPAADGGGDGDGGDGEKDVAEVDIEARDRVAEAEAEEGAEGVVGDDAQNGGVQPDDGHVGEAEEPSAEEAVVGAEGRGGVGVDAAGAGQAVDHHVEVPRDDGHDQGPHEDADGRAEGARDGQEVVPRHDEGVPAHGAAEGQGPGREGIVERRGAGGVAGGNWFRLGHRWVSPKGCGALSACPGRIPRAGASGKPEVSWHSLAPPGQKRAPPDSLRSLEEGRFHRRGEDAERAKNER